MPISLRKNKKAAGQDFIQPAWVSDIEQKLDNYEIETPADKNIRERPTESHDRVRAILGDDANALSALYADIPADRLADRSQTPTAGRKKRKKFIAQMARISAATDNAIQLTPEKEAKGPEGRLITLEELLGKKGVKAYKKAIKEERDSPAFRDAVFLKSTKHYRGAKWKERLVLWVGGPSASGKSFATDAVVEKVGAELMEKDEKDQSGNHVISIDGGVEREVSQMRQLALQVALQKGYAGISDLHDNTKLKVKRKIENAALQRPDLHLAIPQTFTNPFEKPKNAIKKYAKLPNTKQIFSKVVGGKTREEKQRFKRSVLRMGNSRAWSSQFEAKDTHERHITANNRKIGSESKIYEKAWFYLGKYFSARAREAYEKMQAENGKDSIYLEITNDLIFVYKENNVWKECDAAYQGPTERIPERAFKDYLRFIKERTPLMETLDLPVWYEAHKEAYREAPIDITINRKKKSKAHDQPDNPLHLGNILITQIHEDGQAHKNGIDSLFQIVAHMEAAAKAAFYSALHDEKQALGLDEKAIDTLEIVRDAYENLAKLQDEIQIIKMRLQILPIYSTHVQSLKKTLADYEKQEQTEKKHIASLERELGLISHIQNSVRETECRDEAVWQKMIDAIPDDPLNEVNIFTQPVSTVDSNQPRHEDIRLGMTRDLNQLRYVAAKGESGGQKAGPKGGWYIGCYQTPDRRIHTQRFMVKREDDYAKNIIESLAGRLKSSLVNLDDDYIAGTFLIRQADLSPTGENTYAVSIAFDDFKESHQLAGFEKREKMAGTKKKLFDGKARKIFDKIEELYHKKHKGLPEILSSAWWVGDNDVHTGNVGFGMGRFLGIDHAGSLIELDGKIHAGRGNLFQNALRLFRRHPEPTYHAAEYSSEIRHSREMADTIKRCVRQMSAQKIQFIIGDEINKAVEHYRDHPSVFKQFAKRISVPKAFLKGKTIDQQADITKEHLFKLMHARLVNLRQYANEIELSLCFEYQKSSFYKRGEFVIKDQKNLEQFIRENPNYALGDKHHFRGESHGQGLSMAYHQTHNVVKYTTGNQLEQLFEATRQKVLAEKETFGIRAFMANDFAIEDINTRATKYSERLNLIKSILQDANVLDNNPYKEKIDELIYFLDIYQSGTRQQHLVQLCDETYGVIQHIFKALDNNNDNNAELMAKIKFYELFKNMHNDIIPDLNAMSVDQSAFTQEVSDAANELEQEIIQVEFNAARKKVLESKLETIEIVTAQLLSLSQGAPQENIQNIKTHLQQMKEKLHMQSDLTKQEHFTSTRELHKADNPDFLQQGADMLNRNKANAENNLHVVSQHAGPHIASTATEDTAILLDHPGAEGKAGAVMMKEGDTIKIFDFENPEISFASVLTKLLLPYIRSHHLQKNSPELENNLRDYIQENYIDKLQDKRELVSEHSIQTDLIHALMSDPRFQLKMPYTGFFKMSTNDFASQLLKKFHDEVAKHRSDLMEWAMIWIKTLEAQGHQAKDMFLEGSSGNTEFARLFLTLVCAKGDGLSNLQSANQTGYDFNITKEDIALMRDRMNSEEMARKVTEKVQIIEGEREFNITLVQIKEHLSRPLVENSTKTQLEETRNQFMNDHESLSRFKSTCKHLPLYVEVNAELSKKITAIDAELKRRWGSSITHTRS